MSFFLTEEGEKWYYIKVPFCGGGGIGRRAGLRILSGIFLVRVQVPPTALILTQLRLSFFIF